MISLRAIDLLVKAASAMDAAFVYLGNRISSAQEPIEFF
jgi:hypothetical protein